MTEQRRTPEELLIQQQVDSRSVYVGNLEFASTPEALESLFRNLGTVNRVTILSDKTTGHPKGYAYVEFQDKESATRAVDELNGSQFRGRSISVAAKRTNLPGFARPRGRGRGRGRWRDRSRKLSVDVDLDPREAQERVPLDAALENLTL